MRELWIDGIQINEDSECYVIAEIGHNHQGSIDKAKALFLTAKQCGAHAVKLQKRDNRALFTRALYEQPYLGENSYGDTYGAHREALELGYEAYVELKQYAAEIGITFFATAFDFNSADLLAKLEMPAYKIASGDLVHTPLLKHVARLGKPMIVSTGGGTMDDVQRAYDTIMPLNSQLCLLQCTAMYPVEPEDMNLRVIETFRQKFPEIVIGLSDHQNGIAMAMVGYTLGARVIEKHFTLNRAWRGTDHAFSLEPTGMKKLTRDLQRARAAMGDGLKRRLPAENKPLYKMGKKLVAARELAQGHLLRQEDIAIKSPNDGMPPYEIETLLGRVTRRPLHTDEAFTMDDLEPPSAARN